MPEREGIAMSKCLDQARKELLLNTTHFTPNHLVYNLRQSEIDRVVARELAAIEEKKQNATA